MRLPVHAAKVMAWGSWKTFIMQQISNNFLEKNNCKDKTTHKNSVGDYWLFAFLCNNYANMNVNKINQKIQLLYSSNETS